MAGSPEILHVTSNAYRILGILGNATREVIHRAQDVAQASLTIGVTSVKAWDLPWIGEVSRSETDVKEAIGYLSDPEYRLHERLFWFHEGEEFLKGLSIEDADETAARWAEANSPAALHDSALLKYITAFVLDRRLEDAERWRSAISSWKLAVESDAYWKHVADIERRGAFTTRIRDEEIQSLRDRSFRLAVDSIFEHALHMAGSEDRETSHRAIKIFRMAELPQEMLAEFEGQVLGPLEKEFHTLCSEIRRKCDDDIRKDDHHTDENRATCLAALARFTSEVEPELAIVLDLCDGNSPVGRKSIERAAFCLQGLALNYIWAREFETAGNLLAKAKGMVPPDSILIRHLEESAATVAAAATGEITPPDEDPFLHVEPKEPRSARLLLAFAAGMVLFTAIGAYLYSAGYLTDKRAVLSPAPKKEASPPTTPEPLPATPSPAETIPSSGRDIMKAMKERAKEIFSPAHGPGQPSPAPAAPSVAPKTESPENKAAPPPPASTTQRQEAAKKTEPPAPKPATSGIYAPSHAQAMKAKKAKETKSKAEPPKTSKLATPKATTHKSTAQRTDEAAAVRKEKARPATHEPAPSPAPKEGGSAPASTATAPAGKEMLKSLEAQIAQKEATMSRLEQRLGNLMRELEPLERNTANYRASIQQYEKQVESGASIDREKYKHTVEEYNRLTHAYNERLTAAQKTAAEHEALKKQYQKLIEQRQYLSGQ